MLEAPLEVGLTFLIDCRCCRKLGCVTLVGVIAIYLGTLCDCWCRKLAQIFRMWVVGMFHSGACAAGAVLLAQEQS